MGGETEIEEGIDVSEIRENGRKEVLIEDNTRLMKFREDYEVKRARRGRKDGGGLKGANLVQDILRGWNTISAHASD